MNTPSNKLPLLIILLCINFLCISQDVSEGIWVTFESTKDVPVSTEGKLSSNIPFVQRMVDRYSIVNIEQAVPSSTKEPLQKVYEVTCHCDAEQLMKEMKKHPSVLTNPVPAPEYQVLDDPNDYTTAFQTDYALDLINAKDAWQYSIGDESTVIGISDDAFNPTHEELEGKLHYIDPSISTTNYYHGTAVAITAAGETDNGVGKSSIGYDCNLHLTVISYEKLLQMSQNGIRVINLSWMSGCVSNMYIQQVVDEIYENGTILVAAAGNGSTCGGAANPVFPAACDNVISVTSVGPNDNHEQIPGNPFSTHQHNSTVDLCAPGYDIATSIHPEYYNFTSGSSFAAPYVSGTIGLMLSLRPCLTNEEILDILSQSSDNIDTLNPNYAGQLGWGRLNAGKALELTEMNNCMNSGGHSPIGDPVINDSIIIDPQVLTGTSVDISVDDPQPEAPYYNQVSDKFPQNQQKFDVGESSIARVVVYPNPTRSSSIIRTDFSKALELIIMDAQGRIIRTQSISSGKNETQIELLTSGIYFVGLSDNGTSVWLERLVKL